MKTIRIYHSEEIKSFEDLIELMTGGSPACMDPPCIRCVCQKCYEYEIKIDKVAEKNNQEIQRINR